MLQVALGRVPSLLIRARPWGPGLRRLWGRGARPEAEGRGQAWSWRRWSSAPAHYQLVYTCKVGTPWGRGRAAPGLDSAAGRGGPGAGRRAWRGCPRRSLPGKGRAKPRDRKSVV